MFIPYFECSGHHQFSLPGIQKIEAEFNSPVQIIIGSNGAGKSTLLREMHPLPAQSADYAPGGYKRMIILDKGNRFFLESHFGKPVKHTFELNGENLNVSGKETEQRKLVKDYFGITPQLIRLITGEILFSSLSSQARRDWLMAISGMNFDYGMQFFQRVRDFNRDARRIMTGRICLPIWSPVSTAIPCLLRRIPSSEIYFLKFHAFQRLFPAVAIHKISA
jgi:hypothetical protein